MIIRRTPHALHLVTQPDHAALARRIMEQWQPLDNNPRRPSILLAVEQHDNGWREPDAAPTVDPDTGRVHDFINAPDAVRQGVWPRGVARLSHDPWAAALVAQHALTVYERYRGDEGWARFFSEMESSRDTLLASTRHSLEQLLHDYTFVRIGDLISLIFCNQWDEEKYDRWAFRRIDDRVVITPDAFGGREIAIAIDARQIEDVPYRSDADLRDALRASSAKTLRGVVCGD